MIIIGARAKLKDAVLNKYIPDLETEAMLLSVSSISTPQTQLPIRSLRSRGLRGKYTGARSPLSISFNFSTNAEIAQKYFERALIDLSIVTGAIYRGEIKSFSQQPFAPVSISNISWEQNGGNAAANYSITLEYFNLDLDYSAAQPVESQIFDIVDRDFEIDLRDDNDIPVESYQYNISQPYEIMRTLDGYAGVRYNFINLIQSVNYYDSDYVFDFHFDDYVNQDTALIERSSDISTGGKLLYKLVKTAPLLGATDSLVIDSLGAFNASS